MASRIEVMQKSLSRIKKFQSNGNTALTGLRGYADGSACAASGALLIKAENANPRGAVDCLTDASTGADMDLLDRYPDISRLFDDIAHREPEVRPLEVKLNILLSIVKGAAVMGKDLKDVLFWLGVYEDCLKFGICAEGQFCPLAQQETEGGKRYDALFNPSVFLTGLEAIKALTLPRVEPELDFTLTWELGPLLIRSKSAAAELIIAPVRSDYKNGR